MNTVESVDYIGNIENASARWPIVAATVSVSISRCDRNVATETCPLNLAHGEVLRQTVDIG